MLPPGDGYYHCPCHAVRVQPEIKRSCTTCIRIDMKNATMSSLFPHSGVNFQDLRLLNH